MSGPDPAPAPTRSPALAEGESPAGGEGPAAVPAPATAQAAGQPDGPGRGVSRRERIALAIHRGLDKHLSPFGVWVFRRTKGSIAKPWKVNALLLTTRGRRSGKDRTVVLQYFPDGDAVVVVAANDGGEADPAWYLNLVAEPRASVEIEGRRRAVVAEELAPNEAAAWWHRILEISPEYERYARATDRRFPVIRLVPER